MEPDELRYREFRRSVRGYSPDEVDDLLDAAADGLDGLLAERDRLCGELEEARSRIERYESLEGSIRATLARAEKAADDYQEAARREAEAMLRDAEARSRRMLADASGKVDRVRDSYEALRETRHAFDADFRSLLEGYLRLLEEAGSATAREIEEPLEERLDHEATSAAREAAEEEGVPSAQEPREQAVHGETGEDSGRGPEPPAHEGAAVEEATEDVSGESSGESREARRGGFLRRRG